jgi:hypothetical protein
MEGTKKAQEIAKQTMTKVKKAMKLDYLKWDRRDRSRMSHKCKNIEFKL